MNISLEGKNALVCGGSEGIGKAIALQFASLGANVTIIARNEETLKNTVAEFKVTNIQNHGYIVADFSDPDNTAQKVAEHIKSNKSYQILVNNSGGPAPGLISEATADEFLNAFRQHLIVSQKLVQEILPYMKELNFGRIINVISIGVKQPIDILGVSNSIRGAMASWAKTLSRELAGHGITVNNILPGYTKTARLDSLLQTRAQNAKTTVDEIKKSIYADIPAGRFAKPEEIGYLAGFLASDLADYISGTSIPIDGAYLRTI